MYRLSHFNYCASFRIIEGAPYPQKGRPCVYQLIRKPHCRTQKLYIIDITVTLTFIRIMDQSTPINPSNQSTLIEPKGVLARLKSVFSLFSWWSYFANQIEEVGNIDTLAPLFLHSSMTGRPTHGLRIWWANVSLLQITGFYTPISSEFI